MPALDITSEISAVGPVTDWVAAVGHGLVDQAKMHDVRIACAEVLNNIILHAYRRRAGMPIAISFDVFADRVALVFRDRGSELPVSALSAAVDRAFEPRDLVTLPESGVGIALIRACSDIVHYRRDGLWNELTLTFCIHSGDQSAGDQRESRGI